jgi:ParB/RepB/Spo0J family partition protein
MENIWIPELVPLDQCGPNPWQVRAEDAAHVMDVARSIAEHDLIQPGTGRRVDGRVQLAVAHTRLAAFRYLNEQFGVPGNGQAGDKYTAFPVIVRELSDEQMAAYAIEENFKRKDLSAIEKGRALQRYLTDFGKTQAEAGERLNLTQSAVSHLLRLLDLPEPVQDLVNQGALPERFARQLVSLAKVAPEDVVQAAQVIAEAPADERDETADRQIGNLLDEHGRSLSPRSGSHWPMDWRPEADPEAASPTSSSTLTTGLGLTCQSCPARVVTQGESTCTSLLCFEARKAAWLQRELERVAAKFKVAIAAPGESVKTLEVGYGNESDIKVLLKRKSKPDCLRVMPITEDGYSYKYSYHSDVLGSRVIALGSTDPTVLRREQAAKEARAKGVDLPADDEIRGQAADQEEAEREERREARAAVRRAMHDIPWLIFHTAEACGEQLQVSGMTLRWMYELVEDHYHTPNGWLQFDELFDPLDDQMPSVLSKKKAPDSLVRQMLLVHRFSSEIWTGFDPKQSYDWPRTLEMVQKTCEELDLKPGTGWNEPPIWTTETNCHVCGKFTSMDHVTKRDEEEGWAAGERVTCSEECRSQVAKSPAKPKAKRK